MMGTAKKQIKSLNLFPDMEVETYGGSLNASNKPRRGLKKHNIGKYKEREGTAREKRNKKLWANLYPTPKK